MTTTARRTRLGPSGVLGCGLLAGLVGVGVGCSPSPVDDARVVLDGLRIESATVDRDQAVPGMVGLNVPVRREADFDGRRDVHPPEGYVLLGCGTRRGGANDGHEYWTFQGPHPRLDGRSCLVALRDPGGEFPMDLYIDCDLTERVPAGRAVP